MKHEGVAAECLFQLFAGGRRMTEDERMKAFAACAVIASTMEIYRERKGRRVDIPDQY